MRNAIILHGLPGKTEYYSEEYPSPSNSHWLPWVQKHLMVHDIKADTPEIPFAFDPDYQIFVKEVERFDITPDTILVGHSMGAGFWVRYLSEHPKIIVDKVVLVAPWLNISRENDTDFFDFKLDFNVTDRVGNFIIFRSDDDKKSIHESVDYLNNSLTGVILKEFSGYGHFTLKSMKTEAFPELLEILL
jgi:predicted alpha/beta hydrolase family esterase